MNDFEHADVMSFTEDISNRVAPLSPTACGAQHPKWPEVRCIHTGKCVEGLFAHSGHGQHGLVRWGEGKCVWVAEDEKPITESYPT